MYYHIYISHAKIMYMVCGVYVWCIYVLYSILKEAEKKVVDDDMMMVVPSVVEVLGRCTG